MKHAIFVVVFGVALVLLLSAIAMLDEALAPGQPVKADCYEMQHGHGYCL